MILEFVIHKIFYLYFFLTNVKFKKNVYFSNVPYLLKNMAQIISLVD